jgi:phage-related protein
VGGAGVSGGGGGGIKGAGAGMGALTVAVAMGDIIVELLKKAVDFLMNLEPIKALTDVIDNILKLFFMPLALMLMMILLPIFKAIVGALGSASWTAFMKTITDIGKTIGDLFASFISVLGKQNLITGLKALFLLIATPVIALGIVVASIVTLITAIVSAVGFLINLVRAGIGEIVGGYKEFVSLVNKFWSDVVKGISDIAGWLSGAFISAVKEIIAGIGIVVKFFSDIWSWITGGVNAVLKLIGNGISIIVNVVLGIWDWLNRILGGFLSSIMSVFNSIESILSKIPHFQSGGYVPSNTLAVLHAGEVVVPSNIVKEAKSVGGNSFVISINMSNNISSNVDVQRLADDIERELEKRLRRLRTW